MEQPSFTERYVDWDVVAKVEDGAIHGTRGWVCGAAPAAAAILRPGTRYGVETHRNPHGRISGVTVDGIWYDRKSDQDLERQRLEWLEQSARRDGERLAKHRAEWIGREEMLPPWLKDRIHVFHERGGENFELGGWGYELVVCELAALYAESGCEDTDAVWRFADEQGTSGNQHDCAKALARAHLRGESLAGTVAALSPLTGSAYYDDVPA